MAAWADSLAVEFLKATVRDLSVAVDSIRSASSHAVSIVSDSTHPLLVRQLESMPNGFVAVVTHPGFTFVWSAVVGLAAFAAGRIYEFWNDQNRKNEAKWTSARLTKRYLLLARDQILALIERFEDPKRNLAEAHVAVVLRAVGDFDEIRARMIALEDDEVEEAIFQWNLVATDDLLEVHDRLTMEPSAYLVKYGVAGPLIVRDISCMAALRSDSGKANDVVAQLQPYLDLRKAKPKQGRTPSSDKKAADA